MSCSSFSFVRGVVFFVVVVRIELFTVSLSLWCCVFVVVVRIELFIVLLLVWCRIFLLLL